MKKKTKAVQILPIQIIADTRMRLPSSTFTLPPSYTNVSVCYRRIGKYYAVELGSGGYDRSIWIDEWFEEEVESSLWDLLIDIATGRVRKDETELANELRVFVLDHTNRKKGTRFTKMTSEAEYLAREMYREAV